MRAACLLAAFTLAAAVAPPALAGDDDAEAPPPVAASADELQTAVRRAHGRYRDALRSAQAARDPVALQKVYLAFRDEVAASLVATRRYLEARPEAADRDRARRLLLDLTIGRVRFSAAGEDTDGTLAAYEEAHTDFPGREFEPAVRGWVARALRAAKHPRALEHYRRVVEGQREVFGKTTAGARARVDLGDGTAARLLVFWESG